MIWFSIFVMSVGLTVLRILWRDDIAAPSRLAWMLIIVIFPLAGIIVYFLFGEADLGKSKTEQSETIAAAIETASKQITATSADALNKIDHDYRPAFAYAQSINGFDVQRGNKAELMPTAEAARRRIIDDIDAAKHSVNVLYYIWLKDNTGTDMAKALMRAARRGVTCRVMADGLGSKGVIHSSLWKDMTEAGVQTVIALPFTNMLKVLVLSRFDLRNHRKITVIDDNITYCGSQNCADPEFRVKKKYAPWIDIMVRFTGPIAAQNQLLFASDWLLHTDEDISAFTVKIPPSPKGLPAVIWGDGPTTRKGAAQQMFATLMGQARETLIISTPYFVPGDVVLDAICACAFRGIDVSLILPAKNDSRIVSAASRSHYGELLRAGVKIYEHAPGLLHAKTLTVDGKVGLIGSSNLDLRSFDLNYENNILFEDEPLVKAISQRQSEYIKASKLIIEKELTALNFTQRIWNNIIVTLGPLL